MEGDIESLIALGAEGIFYLSLLVFVVHTSLLSYHWFQYGTSKRISLTALALYLGGGALIFMTLAITLSFM